MLEFRSIQIVLTFILFLFPFLVFWKRFKPNGPISRLPPGPWKLPIIGNLHQLIGSLPHHSLRELAKKYGPIMQLQLGEVLAVVISSPEAAREVLQTHELAFAQRPLTIGIEAISYDHPGIIFAPYGEYWRQLRKLCVTELLSAKCVRSFRSVREEEAWNLVESISSSCGNPIHLGMMIVSMTNAMIARAAFGKTYRGQTEFSSLLKELLSLSSGFTVPDCFPSVRFLSSLTGLKANLQRIKQKIDTMLEDIINDHKMKVRSTSTRIDEMGEKDLVDLLLKLQESSELKYEFTSNHLKIIVLDIFSAGSETASTTLEWTMSELLRNPKVMEKAQAENLDYLKLVIKESLRIHPPAPFVLRESSERCEVMGYEIPKKTKILISAWALGRDPEVWANADSFQPERFVSSSIDLKGTNFEFIPFGAGRRMCPGMSFAFANVELALAQLLYHFDWKTGDGAKPEELDMSEAFGLTCRRKNDLYLIATPVIPFLNEKLI
ncbi:hypothetical protein UlMin_044479 [Ulmus minor]